MKHQKQITEFPTGPVFKNEFGKTISGSEYLHLKQISEAVFTAEYDMKYFGLWKEV